VSAKRDALLDDGAWVVDDGRSLPGRETSSFTERRSVVGERASLVADDRAVVNDGGSVAPE
jgi:hypothetical protein